MRNLQEMSTVLRFALRLNFVTLNETIESQGHSNWYQSLEFIAVHDHTKFERNLSVNSVNVMQEAIVRGIHMSQKSHGTNKCLHKNSV